jgi:hypothetical protein
MRVSSFHDPPIAPFWSISVGYRESRLGRRSLESTSGVRPHNFNWGPGYLATCHLVASMPRPSLVETAFVKLDRSPYPLFDPARPTLTLSEAAGLGFEPDWEVFESYMVNRQAIGRG